MNGWDWSNDGWIVLVGILCASSCALLGNFLVLRRMSLMGDAISHAVLPGLAIAFLVSESRSGLPMLIGAVAAGTLTALLSEMVSRYGKVEPGAAMGVIFSVLFALGLILIRQAADHVDLDPGCVLYGNLTHIPLEALDGAIPHAVVNLVGVLGLDLLFVVLFFKELKISTFDPQLATTLGINAQAMHYALMIMVSITTVANFEAVGSILVIAMLIVPAATAHLLTDRLGAMIAVSLIIAFASAVLGHILAAFGPGWIGINADAGTAAMMAVVTGLILTVAVFFAPQHGLLSRLYHRLVLSQNIIRDDILGLLHRWQEWSKRDSAGAAGRPITRAELLTAVGDGALARLALRQLARHGDIVMQSNTTGGIVLQPAGASKAATMVRSHRLWEAYLAKHFQMPLDHLHMSAERVEHYITPQLRAELSAALPDTGIDPHGKEIPPEA